MSFIMKQKVEGLPKVSETYGIKHINIQSYQNEFVR
jgi:hypothetical protein